MSAVTCVSSSVRKTCSKCTNGRARAAFRPEFLLDPLEDQHVRVDAHAHRQDESGNAAAASRAETR